MVLMLPDPELAFGVNKPVGSVPRTKIAVPAVARRGDLWLLGRHRIICGDVTDPLVVRNLMGDSHIGLLFTSPPYDDARLYEGNLMEWTPLMKGMISACSSYFADDAQLLVNLGLRIKKGEWHSYWDQWIEWMWTSGWRRYGWYVWDQGAGLPGEWRGRLWPSFEFVFHFNKQSRELNKTVKNKNAGEIYTARNQRCLTRKDGSIDTFTHAGKRVPSHRVPDNVIRIVRNIVNGLGRQHPATFPVELGRFVLEAFSDTKDCVFDPFVGSGTTLIAGELYNRQVFAAEIEPTYVDLAIARYLELGPSLLDDRRVRLSCGTTYREALKMRT